MSEPAGVAYDADYYERGKETGKSLYTDYRWLPDLTLPMVRTIADHLGIDAEDTILDFGCAKGYVVRAFREIGYQAWGVDCSEWAIANADPAVALCLCHGFQPPQAYDWIIAKDVLEHIPSGPLESTLKMIGESARRGVFIIVPLSSKGIRYDIGEYEADATHVQRMSILQWYRLIVDQFGPDYKVEVTWRIRGLKDNWYGKDEWREGNGFITAKRWQPYVSGSGGR